MSGALTGGILAARAGPKQAASSAAIGGVLLALIEGMQVALNKYLSPAMPSPEDYAATGAYDPTTPPTMGPNIGSMLPSISGSQNNQANAAPLSQPDGSGENMSVEAAASLDYNTFNSNPENTFDGGSTFSSSPAVEEKSGGGGGWGSWFGGSK